MSLYILTLKICYLFFKFLPTRNQVIFITRRNKVNSIEFNRLIGEIKKRDASQKIVVLNNLADNKFKTLLNSYIETYYIARSRYVIVDSYIIPVSTIKHKSGTRIIQVWHALGAIKKFGHGTIGKESGNSASVAKSMKMHEGYDYIIAGSEATVEIYQRGFNVNAEKIMPIGTPTVDYLLDKSVREGKSSEIHAHYRLDTNKEVILYAPTFRKDKRVQMEDLLTQFDTSKYIVVVKAHPLDVVESDSTDIIFDKKFSTTDWLFVADRVISDYSAMIFEASVLDLPQYHYAYDYEEYSIDPGLFMDYYAEMPGLISKDAGEIVNAINEKQFDEQKSHSFKHKYLANLDGSSTEKIIDLLFKR